MREVSGRRLHSRVKGRPAIQRSLRSLVIRVHRFARARAVTAADRQWAARTIDTLTLALNEPTDSENSA